MELVIGMTIRYINKKNREKKIEKNKKKSKKNPLGFFSWLTKKKVSHTIIFIQNIKKIVFI